MENFWKQAVESVNDFNPTDEELESVEQWMTSLDQIAMEQLAYNGDFAQYNVPVDQVEKMIQRLTVTHVQHRQQNPLVIADMATMAAEVESAMRAQRSAQTAEQQDTPNADAWLWSPIGTPIQGNSARLSGYARYEAHLALLQAAHPQLGEPQDIIAQIDAEAHMFLADQIGKLVEHNEEQTRLYAARDEYFSMAPFGTQQAYERAAELTHKIVDNIFETWICELLYSTAGHECIPDAAGWMALDTCTRLAAWRDWIAERIKFMGAELGAADRASYSYLWWTAAELLVTAELLQMRHPESPAEAAAQMAAYLMGRDTESSA